MLFAVTQLAGCGGGDKKAADSKGAGAKQVETLKVAISAWPKNLDPVVKMGKTSTPIITQVFDTLLYVDNNGKLTSYICDSWKKIDDTTINLYYAMPSAAANYGVDTLVIPMYKVK